MRLLSSYFSEDDVRHAKVFWIEDFDQRPYQCRVFTTNGNGTSSKDFIHTLEAEDFAENWVLNK
tara:strand:+ start:940 stop:1131 length:192 start_codon:yes stop_codon:yes gene_type:complete